MDWKNKRVFITGHTGFKGGWLTLMLASLGAKVKGYSLAPPTQPSFFHLARVEEVMESSVISDILDLNRLKKEIHSFQPEIVFHLAAQPLVRESYQTPSETFMVNGMGTLNVLEALREVESVRAAVMITTDKCYHNFEWPYAYRENDALGGKDPYSASKAVAEIIIQSYHHSFFQKRKTTFGLASARAGNVLGGGDYAVDRIVPDCIRALSTHQNITLRNPQSIRPWLFVLEPLYGYILLAEKLLHHPQEFSGAWNFSPQGEKCRTVQDIVQTVFTHWKNAQSQIVIDRGTNVPEANFLQLDSTKALRLLNWQQQWPLDKSLELTVEWYQQTHRAHTFSQQIIHQFMQGIFQNEIFRDKRTDFGARGAVL